MVYRPNAVFFIPINVTKSPNDLNPLFQPVHHEHDWLLTIRSTNIRTPKVVEICKKASTLWAVWEHKPDTHLSHITHRMPLETVKSRFRTSYIRQSTAAVSFHHSIILRTFWPSIIWYRSAAVEGGRCSEIVFARIVVNKLIYSLLFLNNQIITVQSTLLEYTLE